MPAIARILARFFATLMVALSLYWIYLFTQTNFRPQWAPLYLSIASVMLVIGAGVWLGYRWAIFGSVVVATIGLAFTCLMLVGAPLNWVLWLQGFVLPTYIVVVGPLAFRAGKP